MSATIDMHAHIVPAPLRDALRVRTSRPLLEGDGRFLMPVGVLPLHDGFWSMESRLALMSREGVAMQILSLPPLFGIDTLPAEDALQLTEAFNEGAAAFCAARPERFRWLAALPLAAPEAALARLGQALDDPACLGAILPGDPFASLDGAAAMLPYLGAIEARGGGLVFIHPGRSPGAVPRPDPYPDLVFARRQLDIQTSVAETAITLLYSDILDPFPRVQVQLANLAGTLPMVMERIDNTLATRPDPSGRPARLGRLTTDVASLGPAAIALAARVLGPEALVFGTDCPIYDTRATNEAVAQSGLGPDALEMLLSGNAARAIAATGRG